jgi:ABC-2 type transport system ATP-binding protein
VHAPLENSIQAHGLVREFKKGPRAVDGIDLHVDSGEIYGFLGPNGAGKSTTVHMLTTLLPPTAGTATVAGYDVVKEGPQIRKVIGAALQEAALDPFLTGREHLRLQTTMHGITGEERRKRSEELLTRVGLTEAADRKVKGYSGGMKRRLDLALALVHRPRVIFLDEPTTGLDVQSRSALWVEVGRLAKEDGVTVFLTTQYLEEADRLADRIAVIDGGRVVAEGTAAELKRRVADQRLDLVLADAAAFAAVDALLGDRALRRDPAGRVLGVATDGTAAHVRALLDAIDPDGDRVARFAVHDATLDDVFLALTGRPAETNDDAKEIIHV